MGVNASGLGSKLSTFRKVLSDLRPSVFFVEETKFKDEGRLKVNSYVIFEHVRETRDGGGGIALGCIKELNPVLISKGSDGVEAMSVEIFVKSMKIRCCVAYGSQENSLVEKKTAFWHFIDEEVSTAWNVGSGFILQFDGNLWAGSGIIPGDPRNQNKNGKLFQEFLSRHPNLTVVNALTLCQGLITRSRIKEGKPEESVLDFFVVCARVLPYVTSMVIDDAKKHILTNYKAVRNGGKANDSDHFTEYMDVNLRIRTEKPIRREIFNFKDPESQTRFKENTSCTKEFSDCFKSELPLIQKVEKWRQILKIHCQTAFKKIRINKKRKMKPLKPELSLLINKRNQLKKQKENTKALEDIEDKISKIEAEENREIILKNFKKFSSNPENIVLSEMWKAVKNISPKHESALPIAKKNHKGDLISNPGEIRKLLAKEYKQRLRSRPMRPDLGDIIQRREEIFKIQLKLAEENSSVPWKMNDLDKALSCLKNNKSRDHAGYSNEIFKSGIIGTDLKMSLLLMFNKLKSEKLIPSFMRVANITTVPKKGSLILLENERGIFRTDIPRSILMRLIYNDKYPVIDQHMSDGQMGGRKGKGCRDNIFLINGLIHEVMKSKKMKPIMLQISDYKQMFDGMNLKQAISDIYDFGLNDDQLSLVYQANKEIFMAVNTPGGITERQVIENTVLQGDTWGSILASVQVDTIAQECSEEGYGYLYKNILPVGILGLVDDTIGVTETGYQAQMMNAFLNVKTAEKGLQYGIKKCKTMVIGKNQEKIINSKLSFDQWTVEHVEDKNTGDTELVEQYAGQVEIGSCTEQRYLGFTISCIGDNMANIRTVRNKSIGVIRKIFSKLNKLKLQKYYFECGVIFLNVTLRSSILYACETYYELKESEIRQLERIEESYMRQLLKTTKGCPITQIYLDLGQIPARFYIYKMRLLFLKHILNQKSDSLIQNFFNLQLEQPTKGDWASACINDLKQMDINLSLKEISEMKLAKYQNLVRRKCKLNAFEYLMKKRGSKGKEIHYLELEMSEYLLPNDMFKIEQQRYQFSLRNRMINIPDNFSANSSEKCICGVKETMQHVFSCEYLNKKETKLEYEKLFHGNLSEQKIIAEIFEEKMQKRNIKNEDSDHGNLFKDPPFSVDKGNG